MSHKEPRKKLMEQFLRAIEGQEHITKFGERLWASLVDFVTVYSKDDVRFTFKNGMEIKA